MPIRKLRVSTSLRHAGGMFGWLFLGMGISEFICVTAWFWDCSYEIMKWDELEGRKKDCLCAALTLPVMQPYPSVVREWCNVKLFRELPASEKSNLNVVRVYSRSILHSFPLLVVSNDKLCKLLWFSDLAVDIKLSALVDSCVECWKENLKSITQSSPLSHFLVLGILEQNLRKSISRNSFLVCLRTVRHSRKPLVCLDLIETTMVRNLTVVVSKRSSHK